MTDLINGRTPEAIKRWISSRTTCNTCSKEHETGCEYGERTEDCQMCIDTIAYIERLEAKQPKWISVKERLPEDGELVLVTMNGEIHGAKLFNRAYELACYYRDGEDEEGEYHIDGWELWDYRDGEVSALEVFYWMPLPEPPEEEIHETTD